MPWGEALRGLVLPSLQWDGTFLTTLVAILGTTISPYLFIWQSSQEAEEQRIDPDKEPLKFNSSAKNEEYSRIRIDTMIGMAFSNIIAISIIIATAATLHANGKTNIETSAQAAEALRPLAGAFAELIFALGIIGTGLLAIPVLAGSTAYAIGEGRKWPVGLSRKPKRAVAFYSVLAISVVIGIGLNFTADGSDQSALLECRGQWRFGASRDGTHDAARPQEEGHGRFAGGRMALLVGLARHDQPWRFPLSAWC